MAMHIPENSDATVCLSHYFIYDKNFLIRLDYD